MFSANPNARFHIRVSDFLNNDNKILSPFFIFTMLAETSTSDELPHIEYHIKGAWSTDLLFLVVAAQYFAFNKEQCDIDHLRK